MIKRIWHGWTKVEKADKYEEILFGSVIPGIRSMNIEGFLNIEVLRRRHKTEVEFITIMTFDSLESIKSFVGEDYEVAHVPEDARAVLSRFDDRSQHYEVRDAGESVTNESE